MRSVVVSCQGKKRAADCESISHLGSWFRLTRCETEEKCCERWGRDYHRGGMKR
jgi:hypothetical protein